MRDCHGDHDAPEFLDAHPSSKQAKPGLSRRMVRGLLSAAGYVMASLMLLPTAPVLLVVSDRADMVRWSNQMLDLVRRW
jgi:hypothetical protein